jgi:hypothetical protein
MTSRRSRLPAAFKHGAFAAVELLPWEDPAAYEQLRQELLEELEPEGALQQECVQDILMATWRKRRVRERRNVETKAVLLEPQNRVFDREPDPLFETRRERTMYSLSKPTSERSGPPRDDYERLLQFSSRLFLDTDPQVVELSVGMLPEEYKVHLQGRVPRDKFEGPHLWITALKKELDGVLLPKIRERRPDPDGYLPAAAELLASEKILEDLAIEERLEAQIDRALRRLFWLKTQKKLDRQSKQKLVEAKVS